MLPNWFDQLGLMAWPLAVCAVFTLAVLFERTVFLVKAHTQQEKHYQPLADYLAAHQLQPKSIRDEIVSIMLNEFKLPYYRGLKTLRIVGVISPMIGLLGTILGIVAAFKIIAVQTGPVSPSMIADGLWEAMLTTAVGLMIALPALLFAHIFHHFNDRKMNQYCLKLNKLSMSYELDNSTSPSERIDNRVSRLHT